MAKKGILFVDDEPNVLLGIKRMLHSLRKNFIFYFAEDGLSALRLMEEHTIDIVVSDMQMPGIDGAELLTEIQQRFPCAIRVMLSGQASEEAVMRTVNVVHQFLDKPCSPDTLKEVLFRSSALRDKMSNSTIEELISSIETLPSLPTIYKELQDVLSKKDANADDVALIIRQDMAMTAKLLKLVNSSFFGFYQTVETPEKAVKLLGFDTIKTLVLGVQIFSQMKIDSPIISLESLWEHSMIVAQCSKKIGIEATGNPDCYNYFLAGMLHDIGRLILAAKMGDAYLPLIKEAGETNIQLCTEEILRLKVSHCDVGAYFVGLWGFSKDIIEAVAFHNNIDIYPGDSFSTALAVHIADAFYYQYKPEESIGQPPELSHQYIEKLGYGDKLESWSKICQSIITNSDDN